MSAQVRRKLSLLNEAFRAFVTFVGSLDLFSVALHIVQLQVLFRTEVLRTQITSVKMRIQVDLNVLQQMTPLEQLLVATSMIAFLIMLIPEMPPQLDERFCG